MERNSRIVTNDWFWITFSICWKKLSIQKISCLSIKNVVGLFAFFSFLLSKYFCFINLKKIKKTILSSAIIFSLFSCSKNDEPTPTPVIYQEESFLSSFLAQSNYGQNTTEFRGVDRESGVKFTSLVNNKMKAIKVRMPAVIANYQQD